MIFSWFDTREEIEFANKLAEHFDREWRSLESKLGHKRDEKRLKLVEQTLKEVQQFCKTRKLNFYKKSKLGNAFKWRLIDLGYGKELINSLTKDILLAMR